MLFNSKNSFTPRKVIVKNEIKNEIKKMYTHLIICRYNQNLYSTNPYNILDKDKWMTDRLIKFKRLLNSLNKQTCLDFKFIVFVDNKTPDKHRKEIFNLINCTLKNVKWEISEQKIETFLKNLKINTDFIITSRIDNDDEYLPNFVKTVQESFNRREEVIDVKGLQYDLINNKKYTSGRETPNSPFISLVEKNGTIKSVYYCSHTNMCKNFKCRFADNVGYQYIQNIHDNNIKNKIIGKKL